MGGASDGCGFKLWAPELMQDYQRIRSIFDLRYKQQYDRIKPVIQERLQEFQNLSPEQVFYELCYCLCTPQSKAEAALQVQMKLYQLDFLNRDIDPLPLLRNPHHYIRFHNQKSQRLLKVKKQWGAIASILWKEQDPQVLRSTLVKSIKGMGWKEASHFLRNIGYSSIAVLDRHILYFLKNEFAAIPQQIEPTSRKKYEEIEKIFIAIADSIGLEVPALDLFLWYLKTGKVLK